MAQEVKWGRLSRGCVCIPAQLWEVGQCHVLCSCSSGAVSAVSMLSPLLMGVRAWLERTLQAVVYRWCELWKPFVLWCNLCPVVMEVSFAAGLVLHCHLSAPCSGACPQRRGYLFQRCLVSPVEQQLGGRSELRVLCAAAGGAAGSAEAQHSCRDGSCLCVRGAGGWSRAPLHPHLPRAVAIELSSPVSVLVQLQAGSNSSAH